MTVGIYSREIEPERVVVSGHRFRVFGRYSTAVRVSEVVLKCVGFIGEVTSQDSEGFDGELLATGFFITVPFPDPALEAHRMGFFVTAGHVAKELRDKPIYIVVNKRGSGVTVVRGFLAATWWKHPTDNAADIAIIPVNRQREADVMAVGANDFIKPGDFITGSVGIGDEAFATGLFTAVPGQTRNFPIVRHGNIAMVPSEKIQTDMGFADVYLVEARSLGGISGSPVFVRDTKTQQTKLLGVMHGHWDVREGDINRAEIIHDRKRGVNMGICIVTPAYKILDILNSEPAKEAIMRVQEEIKKSKKNVPGTDSVRRGDMEEPTGVTESEFEAVLTKVTRKIEDPK